MRLDNKPNHSLAAAKSRSPGVGDADDHHTLFNIRSPCYPHLHEVIILPQQQFISIPENALYGELHYDSKIISTKIHIKSASVRYASVEAWENFGKGHDEEEYASFFVFSQ